MHIPNHVLSCPVTIATAAAAFGGLALAVRRVREIPKERFAKIATLVAFIFIAQMIDVPIAGGTTGHFLGGTLAAILIGPWAASLLMASVLLTQCALLGDGGFTALGANIFSMAIVGPWVGWAAYQALSRHASGGVVRTASLFAASWISTVASASTCALALALSTPLALSTAVTAMVGTHAIVGLGEGVLTVAVVAMAGYAVPVGRALLHRAR